MALKLRAAITGDTTLELLSGLAGVMESVECGEHGGGGGFGVEEMVPSLGDYDVAEGGTLTHATEDIPVVNPPTMDADGYSMLIDWHVSELARLWPKWKKHAAEEDEQLDAWEAEAESV